MALPCDALPPRAGKYLRIPCRRGCRFRTLHFALWVTGLTWPSRRPSRCTAPLQRGFEAPNKADERQTEYATDLPQLKQIEPAGPRFIVADESLRLPKFARHIHLAQAGLLPQSLKKS